MAARAALTSFIRDEKIACDFQPSGRLVGISKEFDKAAIEAENTAFEKRYDIAPQFIDAADLPSYISTSSYKAGIYRPDIGGIHPAKLLHEKVRLARAAGVRFIQNVR